MSVESMLGKNARKAVIRGFLLGLVLQALLVGTVEVVGEPNRGSVATRVSPSVSDTPEIVTLTHARR
jgi:hypothetical protein